MSTFKDLDLFNRKDDVEGIKDLLKELELLEQKAEQRELTEAEQARLKVLQETIQFD